MACSNHRISPGLAGAVVTPAAFQEDAGTLAGCWCEPQQRWGPWGVGGWHRPADPWPPSASPQRMSAGPVCHQLSASPGHPQQDPTLPLLCAHSSVIPQGCHCPAPPLPLKPCAHACQEQPWDFPAVPQRVGAVTAPCRCDGWADWKMGRDSTADATELLCSLLQSCAHPCRGLCRCIPAGSSWIVFLNPEIRCNRKIYSLFISLIF